MICYRAGVALDLFLFLYGTFTLASSSHAITSCMWGNPSPFLPFTPPVAGACVVYLAQYLPPVIFPHKGPVYFDLVRISNAFLLPIRLALLLPQCFAAPFNTYFHLSVVRLTEYNSSCQFEPSQCPGR